MLIENKFKKVNLAIGIFIEVVEWYVMKINKWKMFFQQETYKEEKF